MKLTNLLQSAKAKLGLGLLAVTLLAGLATGTTQARTEYQSGGTGTSKTPVFNEFYNVPNGVGDEADFVRVKTAEGDNSAYTNDLSDNCASGDKFTVRTYVHNGADPDFNATGEAVARNTVVAMNAQFAERKDFTFTSTISADNAASITDSAKLVCGDNVKLKLVPKSVQAYSKPIGGYYDLPDSSVNGTVKIGSRTQGSGDVYACWDDRIIIVYEVVVEELPEEVTPVYSCDLLTIVAIANKERSFVFRASATAKDGATIKDYVYDFGDGSDDMVTDKDEVTHTYTKSGKFVTRVTARFNVDGKVVSKTGAKCQVDVTIKEDTPNCPVPGKGHLSEDSPQCKEVPKELPDTGPADMVGIFMATTVAAGLAHRFVWASRRQG